MKINNSNSEIKLTAKTVSSTPYINLVKDNSTKIKEDNFKKNNNLNANNITKLIPANIVKLDKENNETILDVAMDIKKNFDTVPLDKKMYLTEAVTSFLPGKGVIKIATSSIMLSERNDKIEKSLKSNNTKEVVSQSVFAAKNIWSVANNTIKLANYFAEEAHSMGKISKIKLSNFERATNKVNSINNVLAMPFSIVDVVYTYDSMKSHKENLEENKNNLSKKELEVMTDTYNVKKATFALSAISLGALTSSILLKSTALSNIVLVADISQKISKFLEDENAREAVKNSYNILK